MSQTGLVLNTPGRRQKYRKKLMDSEDGKKITKELRKELGWDYTAQKRYYQKHKKEIDEKSKESRQGYRKEYYQRPEVKERRREWVRQYLSIPENRKKANLKSKIYFNKKYHSDEKFREECKIKQREYFRKKKTYERKLE